MHSVSKHMHRSEPHHENLNEDRAILSATCSPMTLVSGNNKVYVDIRVGTVERGVKRQWGNRKRRFSGFRTLRLQYLRK